MRAASDTLRRFKDLEPGTPARTGLLKAAAANLVDLREFYTTATGEPDWKGSTQAYKTAVSEVYSAAGMSRDEQASVSASVRYHIGNYMRTKLSPEELEDLGLRLDAPRARHVHRREQRSALLTSLTSPGTEAPHLEPLLALTAALGVLGNVTEEELAALSEGGKKSARARLRSISAECKRLRVPLN